MSSAVQTAFPSCAMPGCRNIVADGGLCTECQTAFGDWVRPSTFPPTPPEVLEAREARYREVMAERARMVTEGLVLRRPAPVEAPVEDERKPGQTCWMCEERRTCTKVEGRWECDKCRDVR
ncbi:hypothetical protein SEA_ARGIE_62 [Mycobacterium phage Argie]|nr:hypothetical protein SEA_ARGIE_62 [Mycobacterium phage Argie]